MLSRCADLYTVKDNFIQSVLKEVHFYAHLYDISEWKTVYVGGGTPSQLSLSQISALFKGIFTAAPLACDAEVTMEVNPDDVSEPLLTTLSCSGVNRISMGIQAFDGRALDSVRRTASAESAERALEVLCSGWKGRLSCDLIAGLPNHTYASFEQGVRKLCSFGQVDHISLYTLTVEDGTPLAKNIESGKVRWSQEKADRMWIRGRNILERSGFFQYEVSNFCRPGFQSRHNSVYWRLQDYIGCGAGASGTVYGRAAGDGSVLPAIRWTNTCSLDAYTDFWIHAAGDGLSVPEECIPRTVERLDARVQEFEFLMMGFRMLEGVSAGEYKARFGGSLAERLGAEDGLFSAWKKQGLARTDGNRFALTRRGILLLNRFLEEL